jgi:hypothetical protein
VRSHPQIRHSRTQADVVDIVEAKRRGRDIAIPHGSWGSGENGADGQPHQPAARQSPPGLGSPPGVRAAGSGSSLEPSGLGRRNRRLGAAISNLNPAAAQL